MSKCPVIFVVRPTWVSTWYAQRKICGADARAAILAGRLGVASCVKNVALVSQEEERLNDERMRAEVVAQSPSAAESTPPPGVNCAPLHKRNLANSRGRAKKVRDPPLRGSSRVLGGEAARARVSGVRLHCERQESSGFCTASPQRELRC